MKFLFLLISLSLIPQVVFAEGEDELGRARESLALGYAEEAVSLLTDFLKSRPHEIQARSLRALALGSLGEEDRAIADYESVLEQRDDDKDAHYNLGMLLAFRKKESRHALEHLDRYLSLEDDPKKALKVAQVMKSLDNIFASDLEKKSLNVMREELESSSGVDRKRVLEHILKWNPFSVEALMLVAETLKQDGDAGRAETLCRQSIEIHPTCAVCHEALGEILQQKGRGEEGEKHLMKAKLFEGKS